MFGFGRAKSKVEPIDRRRSLESVPMLNPGVRLSAEDGRTTVTVQLLRGNGFLARFQPPVMERHVKLDELGSFVLAQVDGARTTRQIIEAFVKRYGVNRREAELSCVAFLKSLAARHVISILVMPRGDPAWQAPGRSANGGGPG